MRWCRRGRVFGARFSIFGRGLVRGVFLPNPGKGSLGEVGEEAPWGLV